jgi:hypothetical protein
VKLLAGFILGVLARGAQESPAPWKKTGVTTPGVQIPLSQLKPDAVFEVHCVAATAWDASTINATAKSVWFMDVSMERLAPS